LRGDQQDDPGLETDASENAADCLYGRSGIADDPQILESGAYAINPLFQEKNARPPASTGKRR